MGLARSAGKPSAGRVFYETAGLKESLAEGDSDWYMSPVPADPAALMLLDLIVRPRPVMASEVLLLRKTVGALEPSIEILLVSKMAPSERVEYWSKVRLAGDLQKIGPGVKSVPGKMVIDKDRVEVVVRSTDLSETGLAALAKQGFECTHLDTELHAAIGSVPIEKLRYLAAQTGVVRVELPRYEGK